MHPEFLLSVVHLDLGQITETRLHIAGIQAAGHLGGREWAERDGMDRAPSLESASREAQTPTAPERNDLPHPKEGLSPGTPPSQEEGQPMMRGKTVPLGRPGGQRAGSSTVTVQAQHWPAVSIKRI